MQNGLDLTKFKERGDELADDFASHLETYFNAGDQILRRDILRDRRWREVHIDRLYSLDIPINFLFVETISSLKSIEELLSQNKDFNEKLNYFLEDDALSAEDRHLLTDMFVNLEEVREALEKGVNIYTQIYLTSTREFKKEMREAFAEQPDLVEWFKGHLIAAQKAQEACDEEGSEEECMKDQPETPVISSFFERSEVSLQLSPQQLYRQAHGKLVHLIPQLNEWLTLIEAFNEDMLKEKTYAESIEQYALYCCAFLKMKAFCDELNTAIELMCDYLKTSRTMLEASTRESVVDLLCGLAANNRELVENILVLRRVMGVLAKGYEQHQQHLSPLLCKFMAPWVANAADPLAESVAIWEENQESTNSSENESPRMSFTAK